MRLTPFFLYIFLIFSCATPFSPSGGPKDNFPPVLLHSSVPDQSTNISHTTREIRFYFDENITNPSQSSIIISPKSTFKVQTRGKLLLISDLNLDSNKTYNIAFSEGIGDLNENNKTNPFSIAFSTGNILDSNSLHFKPFHLETGTILTKTIGRLYSSSLIFPDSLNTFTHSSRVNSDGLLSFRNLSPDLDSNCSIFIFNDENGNNNFDSDEAFSITSLFYSDSILPVYLFPYPLKPDYKCVAQSHNIILLSSTTRLPIQSNQFELLYSSTSSSLSPFLHYAPDSFFFSIHSNTPVPFHISYQSDTLCTIDSLPNSQTNKWLSLNNRSGSDSLHLLNLTIPFCDNPFVLKVVNDSDFVKVTKFNNRGFLISFKVDPESIEEKYLIVNDKKDCSPDSFRFVVSSKAKQNSARLIFSYQRGTEYPNSPHIIELVSKDLKTIYRVLNYNDSIYRLETLKPDTYSLRVKVDLDSNGIWFPGLPHKQISTEPVYHYTSEITLKSNWEISDMTIIFSNLLRLKD